MRRRQSASAGYFKHPTPNRSVPTPVRHGHIPLAAMEKLLKDAGAERVGEDAKEELQRVLEEHAKRIGTHAAELASHASRKTVRADDIRLAAKR